MITYIVPGQHLLYTSLRLVLLVNVLLVSSAVVQFRVFPYGYSLCRVLTKRYMNLRWASGLSLRIANDVIRDTAPLPIPIVPAIWQVDKLLPSLLDTATSRGSEASGRTRSIQGQSSHSIFPTFYIHNFENTPPNEFLPCPINSTENDSQSLILSPRAHTTQCWFVSLFINNNNNNNNRTFTIL